MRELEESAREYDFFLALRRLQCAAPGRPPIGASRRPADDAVRFGQTPSLAFAPTTIDSFEVSPETDRRPPRLRQFFFGLFGPQGPLPLHLTEYTRDRVLNHADRTLSAFADIFHHRLLSLFFRAWAVNQPVVQYESGERDRFSVYIASLMGLGMESLKKRDSVPDLAKLFYAGRLAGLARPAEGLADLLQDYFGVPVRLREFVGQWLDIPGDSRCRLGASPDIGRLGHSAWVGSRFRDCRQKFRLELGPMKLADYERFLPGRPGLEQLRDWIRAYAGYEFDWEAQMILSKDAVPATCLGRTGGLGLTTWIRGGTERQDRGDYLARPARVGYAGC